jgi:hypothetical protein
LLQAQQFVEPAGHERLGIGEPRLCVEAVSCSGLIKKDDTPRDSAAL